MNGMTMCDQLWLHHQQLATLITLVRTCRIILGTEKKKGLKNVQSIKSKGKERRENRECQGEMNSRSIVRVVPIPK